jgi:hypothetical protein
MIQGYEDAYRTLDDFPERIATKHVFRLELRDSRYSVRDGNTEAEKSFVPE